MRFVLDASVALLWLVPKTNPAGAAYADSALVALKESQAIVHLFLRWKSLMLSLKSRPKESYLRRILNVSFP